MDDKLSHLAELQRQMLHQFNKLFGAEIKEFGELETFRKYVPPEFQKLQALCLFLEKDFLKAKDGGAYFSACISGAAMIEAFLLVLCWSNQDAVTALDIYRKHAKTRSFDAAWASLSLETLIEIAHALQWIPADIVRVELRTSMAAAYEELASSRGLPQEEIEASKNALMQRPAVALFDLMREIRNSLHAGRWIRERRAFNPEPFDEWSQFGVVMIAEIRDCLAIKFAKDMQTRVSEAAAKYQRVLSELEGNLRNRVADGG